MRQAWQGAFGALIAFGSYTATAHAQLMIVGNDEKLTIDDAGKSVPHEPGHDTLSIIDVSKPEAPKIVASIPLMNTIAGPPTNLAIHPSGEIALVANSLNPEPEGSGWKNVPDDKVFVIDLKANPPAIIATVNAGKQVSGMAIAPKGDIALAANRAGGSISVLSIKGKEVKVVDTVEIGVAGDQVSAVAITPDGKRALAVKAAANKVALLSIDGEKVTYDKRDLPPGIYPYNIAVTPNGKMAITADRVEDRGQEGHQHRRSDGRIAARRRRVQPEGRLPICRQLQRSGFVGAEGRWRQDHRYRQALQTARPSRLDARRPAIGRTGPRINNHRIRTPNQSEK